MKQCFGAILLGLSAGLALPRGGPGPRCQRRRAAFGIERRVAAAELELHRRLYGVQAGHHIQEKRE